MPVREHFTGEGQRQAAAELLDRESRTGEPTSGAAFVCCVLVEGRCCLSYWSRARPFVVSPTQSGHSSVA